MEKIKNPYEVHEEIKAFWDPKNLKHEILEDNLFLTKLWSGIDYLWAKLKEANPGEAKRNAHFEADMQGLYEKAFVYKTAPIADEQVRIAIAMRQLANNAGIGLKYFTQEEIERVSKAGESAAVKELGLENTKEPLPPFTARQTLHDRDQNVLDSLISGDSALRGLYREFDSDAKKREEADKEKPVKHTPEGRGFGD